MTIQERLLNECDKEYAAFQAKLIPGISADSVIGVRVPVLRKIAKEIFRECGYCDFMRGLPHKYYDENILHALLISEIKDYDTCIYELEKFLPYVDNWAVCDIMSPKIFKKNKERLIGDIKKWVSDGHTYTCRFGMEMLMRYFLEEDFKEEYLDISAAVCLNDYYVKMMAAWFFATALAKQWDFTIPYIEKGRLDTWTHNKTIQKAKESFRITPGQKDYLNGLKISKQK